MKYSSGKEIAVNIHMHRGWQHAMAEGRGERRRPRGEHNQWFWLGYAAAQEALNMEIERERAGMTVEVGQ